MAKKSAKKASSKYTKPELRERIKKKLQQSDKGGRPGQWSARKSQMLASEYKAKGGGFREEKDARQQSLDQWTDEKWTTKDGKRARRGQTTSRYLPAKAWQDMSASEQESTTKKKESASKRGQQYVGNTKKAKTSRKKATTHKKKTTGKAASKPGVRKKKKAKGRARS